MKQEEAIRGLLAERARLISFARAIVRDEHTAEDVFQEVMILVVNKHQEIEDAAGLIPWALSAVRYRALHAVRRRSRGGMVFCQSVLDDLESCWASESGPSTAEMNEALRACLGNLSPYSQEIVSLRYGRGLAGQEVARQLDRKPRTIYMALTRIHTALRDCIRIRLAGECP